MITCSTNTVAVHQLFQVLRSLRRMSCAHCTQNNKQIHRYTHKHIHMYTCIHLCTHTYIHTHTHTLTHTFVGRISPPAGDRPQMRNARIAILRMHPRRGLCRGGFASAVLVFPHPFAACVLEAEAFIPVRFHQWQHRVTTDTRIKRAFAYQRGWCQHFPLDSTVPAQTKDAVCLSILHGSARENLQDHENNLRGVRAHIAHSQTFKCGCA